MAIDSVSRAAAAQPQAVERKAKPEEQEEPKVEAKEAKTEEAPPEKQALAEA